MPDSATTDLAELVRDWDPPTVRTSRRVDPWPAAAFADLLDAPAPPLDDGDPLPPMWHWLYLLEHPRTAEIGEDGHPADGPLLPPLPGRRRMFAGGRLELTGDIGIGGELHGSSSVTSVVPKSGRSGPMLFVTVRSELTVDGTVVGVEEQDIVYRSEPDPGARRVVERPASDGPDPDGEWRVRLSTGPVLLSRFSALTYNGHRIHHDRPYVTEVEGYPDLVIHGPLMALLALELPRRHAPGDRVAAFTYRLVRPAFVPSPVVAAGTRAGGTVDVTVAASGADPSLTATVRLR